MIARIRKEMKEKDQGFTLIELLVVIIIIGILAAIAIPVFLNQRQKAWDAAVKSDLKNAATTEETYLTDNNSYSAQTPVGTDLTALGFKYSAAGNYSGTAAAINVTLDGTGSAWYKLCGTSKSGKVWIYDSNNGGLQPYSAAATC